jgi:hypothetical protein
MLKRVAQILKDLATECQKPWALKLEEGLSFRTPTSVWATEGQDWILDRVAPERIGQVARSICQYGVKVDQVERLEKEPEKCSR